MYLSKLKIYKKEKKSVNKKVGKNFKGHITVRHKGSGNKYLKRIINWNSLNQNLILVGLVNNPQNKISLFQWYNAETNSFFFLPSIKNFELFNTSTKAEMRLKLKDFQIGNFFNNLGTNNKSIYVKAPGTFGRIVQSKTWIKDYVLVLLPSGKHKLIHHDFTALPSQLLDYTNKYEKIKKAGRNRWLNKRPRVRGVAMNPVDHPHGGGEGKTSGGRPSVSPLGKLTKNVKTRKNKRAKWQVLL